ncbi:hypothetical protein SEUCBS140593_001105 [Sporothrix eucalyptigena]|uniref:Uncharacterized protein n=1 Tax=Sporothrix eucalyptigena TaxID=1812306 RepID=A0ABP0AVK3_9PEZI
MTQPILKIKADSAAAPHATPNLLPCRVHHSGPIPQTDAFWQPQEKNGQTTAYFRGRKLHGQAVKLPADYRGVIGVRRDSPREQARANNTSAPEEIVDVDATAAEQEAQRQRLDTGELDVLAEFDEVVVWGHQSTADASTDAYVRSMEEWVALSEKIHSYE